MQADQVSGCEEPALMGPNMRDAAAGDSACVLRDTATVPALAVPVMTASSNAGEGRHTGNLLAPLASHTYTAAPQLSQLWLITTDNNWPTCARQAEATCDLAHKAQPAVRYLRHKGLDGQCAGRLAHKLDETS